MHTKVNALKAYLVLLIGTILFCGCETISAVRTGELDMHDVKQVVHTGLGFEGEVPYPQPQEIGHPEHRKGSTTIMQRLTGLDAWFRENLW